MTPTIIIAIDGPAAAGKGTLARRLAGELGLPYLDTGLLYRAVGRRVLDQGANPAEAAVAEAAARSLAPGDLDRTDLRGPAADAAAASVASIPGVRAALLDFQREFGRERGAVLDGRDIGTVVCPDADVKLYVVADVEERARRRVKELQGRGQTAIYQAVLEDLKQRDARDSQRAVAPLKPADDAFLLDTSALDADQALAAALSIISDRLSRASPASPTD